MPVLSGKSPPFGQGKVETTFVELEKEVSRKAAEKRMQFAGMFLLSLTISGSNEAQNPAPYDGNLDPNYRLDQIELNSKNGFKNYDYVPLPQTTLDWLKENYPMPGDAKFMGPMVDKGVSEAVEGSGAIKYPLSNGNKQHIKKHTYQGMKEQAEYLTDEQLNKNLEKNSFFNPNWSLDDINKYAEEAYDILRRQGLTGKLTYEVNGEVLEVFIHSDGGFGTVVGQHKLSIEDFR